MSSLIDVVSVGEAMVELSAREPVPLREARTFDLGWGGDTSNVAVAARRLGGTSAYVTKVGGDGFGASLLDLWNREGVDVSGVSIDPSRPTGVYFLSRQADAPHTFTYYRSGSAASVLQAGDVPDQLLTRSRVVHSSGITQAIGRDPCEAVFTALRVADDAGVTTSYDPNLRLALWPADRARTVAREALSMVDIALPSLDDAKILTGLDDPAAIADDLLALGPRIVALKLGSAGALIASEEKHELIAPYEVPTIDPAGAGDTFDAAFLVACLEGRELSECGDFANAAAALTTTGIGCVSPIPARAAVERLRREQSRRPSRLI